MSASLLRTTAAAAAFFMLGACGGGGGSGGETGSTPPPPVAPPPPPVGNSSITDLKVSQTFASNAAASEMDINLDTRLTGQGSVSTPSLTISYNAATGGYTVAAPDRSSSFVPADLRSTQDGESRYQRSGAAGTEYLTLVTTPYSGTTSNRFVGLGFLQRNSVTGRVQDIAFDTFAYGLDTPASAVPRTGRASWATDVFGLYTAPDQTPRTIQGSGDFTVDFASGHFITSTELEQYDFLTGGSVTGGGIYLESRGRLGSGNSFSGAVSYGGSLGTVAGRLDGRFYGPGAEEIGAAFRADNAQGATLVGALTGQRKGEATPTNFTLGNIVTPQLTFSIWSLLEQVKSAAGTFYNLSSPNYAQTTLNPDGSISITTPRSDLPFLTFTEQDRIASSRADFVSYQKTADGYPVRLDLYRPGSPALALTYAGFGSWERTVPPGTPATLQTGYFTYGLATPRDLLSRRTGTASYEGAAYGTAGAEGAGRYMIAGASRFEVDFGGQKFSGSLTLNATPEGGQGSSALGTWLFASPMSYGQLVTAPLTNGSAGHPLNVITPVFFGPEGEEIAAAFSIVSGATLDGRNLLISGATAAKRR
nr:hypothetical protein [uncultured Sphingomonas sp.]